MRDLHRKADEVLERKNQVSNPPETRSVTFFQAIDLVFLKFALSLAAMRRLFRGKRIGGMRLLLPMPSRQMEMKLRFPSRKRLDGQKRLKKMKMQKL